MSTLTIEPHYLGSLEFFALVTQYDSVRFEIHDSFPKQTYRNRAYFLTANKVQQLVVPVRYANGQPTKEVRVDYFQRWVKDHWGALYSAYGKAPFYEFFSEEYRQIWDRQIDFLVDLNEAFFRMCMKAMDVEVNISFTERYEEEVSQDFRNAISPKKPFSDRKIYTPVPYPQLFGSSFAPNLSIVDLIMNEGPNAAHILRNSFVGN